MEENNGLKFRHEYKYVISDIDLALLKSRIKNIMQLDEHATEQGYSIRSLYFDDYYNRCFLENENGTDPREKFRIRIYNHSTDNIKLECKRKEKGKTYKTSCPLTIEQVKTLMSGRPLSEVANQHPVLQKLTKEMLLRHMRPIIIVEYDRVPYVYQQGNVRVTFDTNISSSTEIKSFLDENIKKRPIMGAGQKLLEVKYDEFLPDHIKQSLQLQNLQYTAFSKYYNCRKYKF